MNTEITLRDYQQQAIDKIKWALSLEGNDLCVLPTGAGKSIVIACLARDLNQDVLILQPSKEILEQNRNKLSRYVSESEIGTYSASLNEKVIKKYTFATIGSVHRKAKDFSHFKIVLIDEAHAMNPKNLGSMFTKFLKEIGNPKVIGFTASPYRNMIGYHRIKTGLFDEGYSLEAKVTLKLINRIQPKFWSRIIFNVNNHELVERGYLCPLKYIDSSLITHEEIPLNKSQSDFDINAYEKKITEKQERILKGIAWAKENHKSVLVFCSSVYQAEFLHSITPDSAVVSSKTSATDRAEIIRAFKACEIKVVFNMGVLTTGFDHPELDCIILNRPTRSLALYYQMLGRGVRIAPNKTHCTVIDFTSTVANLGKIESIKLEKREMWELVTSTGLWHNRALYSYIIKK